MSDDGLADYLDVPNTEIHIQTLMGNTFTMKVSPVDTVGDIKRKIFRVEGIPVHHQNLIFQYKELKDVSRLCDVGVTNGAKLTLVSSMRGGPISARRMAGSCDHHVMLKELQGLLENTREEVKEKLVPGSKVSVLVFKEGDIINLLRVIENDDGSYSPYGESPLARPAPKTARRDAGHVGIFERLVEDDHMSSKIANLRKQMEDVQIRKHSKNQLVKNDSNAETPELDEENLFGEASNFPNKYPFKLLTEFTEDIGNIDDVNLSIFERSFEYDQENLTENEEKIKEIERPLTKERFDELISEKEEELALKEKHRSKPKSAKKSLYSESKGCFSHTRQNYARMYKKTRDGMSRDRDIGVPKKREASWASSSSSSREAAGNVSLEPNKESLTVSTRNRVRLTRLLLSEAAEPTKTTSDSLGLEENAQDAWELQDPAAERAKNSTTCKVGLLKRRQSLDYGFSENIDNSTNKSSEYEVYSGYKYHMSQYVSSPSAIPSQYAPKNQGSCDYFFTNRSPLYGRKTNEEQEKYEEDPEKFNFISSSIQRLKNDDLFSTNDELDSLYGYYNLGCSSNDFEVKKIEKIENNSKDILSLPPVVKKKARCSECNKRLNITNIYNCRCGKMFCSQHRYSEVHRCTYDYKSEGKKILEQQNPLVTAEKVNRI